MFLKFCDVEGTFSRCYGVFCVFSRHKIFISSPFSPFSPFHILSSSLLFSSLLFSSPWSSIVSVVVVSSAALLLLLVAVAARAAAVGAGGSLMFLSGCFSFRVDFSLFLLIFSVIQAIAERLSGALCAARCVHVSWSSR